VWRGFSLQQEWSRVSLKELRGPEGYGRHRPWRGGKGLRLTASTERVRPLLEEHNYTPLPGDEGFRFQKSFGDGQTLLVDLFIAKGASRQEPPVLEKGVVTLAAPGLVYALARRPYFVSLAFADGDAITDVELPLPTLDAAFVLKAALAESGVRMRPDRRARYRVDAVMLRPVHNPPRARVCGCTNSREILG
jgi:hypothetical protein